MENVASASPSRSLFLNPKGEPLKIWLDPKLNSLTTLIHLIHTHGGQISNTHENANTDIIILHPSSIEVFDRYCHPLWLSTAGRIKRDKLIKDGLIDEGEWKIKVLLTENWPGLCIARGRVSGEDMDWGGCRKGGPPKSVYGQPISPPPTSRPVQAPTDTRIPRSRSQSPRSMAKQTRNTPPRDTRQSQQHHLPSVPAHQSYVQPNELAAVPMRGGPSRRSHDEETIWYNPLSLAHQKPPKSAEEQEATDLADLARDRRHKARASVQKAAEKAAIAESKQTPPGQKSIPSGPSASKKKSLTPASAASISTPPAVRPALAWSGNYASKQETRWQVKDQTPPRILEGMRFFLSVGRYGRKKTLQYILQSGGVEAQGWRKATHALLTPISKTEETYQRSIMEQAVALGIWCLPFKWLEASWSAGRILPESIWAYEGGTPLLPRANLPDNQARQGPATTPSEIMPLNSTPTQDLDKLLRGAHLLSLVKGGDKGAVTRHLSLIYPRITEPTWSAMYKNWLNHAAPFLPGVGDKNFQNYRTLFPLYLPLVQQGISLEDISTRLAKDNPESGLDILDWNQMFGNWLRTGDPDTKCPAFPSFLPNTIKRTLHPASQYPGERSQLVAAAVAATRINNDEGSRPTVTAPPEPKRMRIT